MARPQAVVWAKASSLDKWRRRLHHRACPRPRAPQAFRSVSQPQLRDEENMSALADLIVSGRTDDARTLAEADPGKLRIELNGDEPLFPADIALRCGHHDLVVQFIRLGGPMKSPAPSSIDLLRRYLEYLSRSYSPATHLESSVWDQVYEGSRIFFEGRDPTFRMAESEKKDVSWLIDQCDISNRQSFMLLAKD